MHKYPEEVPTDDRKVIVYTKNGSIYACVYKDVKTSWFGKKYEKCFMNTMGYGRILSDEEVLGWNNIPTTEHTI